MRPFPAPLSAVASAVQLILEERGALSPHQLARALDSTPLVLGGPAAEVVDELEESGLLTLVVTLPDERRAYLPAILAERTFTHRVTSIEVEHDLLAADPDLTGPTWLLSEGHDVLTDGRAVDSAMTGLDDGAFHAWGVDPSGLPAGEYVLLPAGLLRELGVGAGDVVGVTLAPDGWRIERVPDAALLTSAPARGERILDLVRAHEPVEVADVVWWACADVDGFRGPCPPVTELLEAWGLTRHGDLVAQQGFDFARWSVDSDVERIRSLHGLGDDDALAVALLRRQHQLLGDLLESLRGRLDDEDAPSQAELERPTTVGLDHDALGAFAEALADPAVAEVLLAETLGAGRSGAAALGLFAESTQVIASPAAQPALGWLLAKAHERRGDVAAAEATLRDVVRSAPFPPALRDLARYASDRGQAAEAVGLLRRSGVPAGDAELALLDRMASTAAHDLGRNQPCWCGSGRKYKVCHLGREELPLAERAPWLIHKAVAYAQDGPWRDALIDVALERSQWSDDPTALYDALGDPLVVDTVLHEGGAFAGFLAERGPLLPEDERLMAEQWSLCDRSLFEVQEVRPRASVTLRDLRTGDVVTVRERTASGALKAGELVLTRVVPAGETQQLAGGIERVRMADREPLLDLLDAGPEPVEIVALLGRQFAPPTLENHEGEPLVLHRARVRPMDLARVVRRLDEALVRADDGAAAGPIGEGSGGAWVQEAEVAGMPTVRASVRLDEGVLTVEANSDRRFDRVMTVLHEADPDAELVEHDVRTGEEMTELLERFPEQAGEGALDAAVDRPEVASAVAELMRRYEESWLDEPVPALAGLTPRQATDDPTRRDDVVRLLRSWPEPTPMSMSRDRLAAALGLDLGGA